VYLTLFVYLYSTTNVTIPNPTEILLKRLIFFVLYIYMKLSQQILKSLKYNLQCVEYSDYILIVINSSMLKIFLSFSNFIVRLVYGTCIGKHINVGDFN